MSQKLLRQGTRLLNEIADFLQNNGNSQEGQVLKTLVHRLEKDVFHLAVVGGYNRGKSTLINALLAEEVLHFDNQPATKSIVRLRPEKKYGIQVHANGQSPQKFRNIVDLQNCLQKMLAEGESNQTITVSLPFSLTRGVCLIDTPGVNEKHETVTYTFINQADSVLYIFGAREQPKTELQFFRNLAEEVPLLCVVNRIDEPNSQADLDHNVEYLKNIIGDFTPQLHLVSGYLGLRGKQWQRRPKQFEAIRATERKLRGYDSAQEMLQESRLPQFETALQTWLVHRRNRQLWRGARLARRALEQVQMQAQQAVREAKNKLDQEGSQLQKQLDDTIRAKKLLEISLQDIAEQLDWTVKSTWQDEGLPAIEAQVDRVKQAANDLVENAQPIDLKNQFFETVNTAWNSSFSPIQMTLADPANQIIEKLTQKIQQDCNETCTLPVFELNIPTELQSPWPLPELPKPESKSKPSGTVEILKIWTPEEQTGVRGSLLRKGVNVWQNWRGITTKLQNTFEQELQGQAATLQSITESTCNEWRHRTWSECEAIYRPLITNLAQRQAELEKQHQALEQNLAQSEAYANNIHQHQARFIPALNHLEQSVETALPIKAGGGIATPLFYLLVIVLLMILMVILLVTLLAIFGYSTGMLEGLIGWAEPTFSPAALITQPWRCV